jgi:hypothetical protein
MNYTYILPDKIIENMLSINIWIWNMYCWNSPEQNRSIGSGNKLTRWTIISATWSKKNRTKDQMDPFSSSHKIASSTRNKKTASSIIVSYSHMFVNKIFISWKNQNRFFLWTQGLLTRQQQKKDITESRSHCKEQRNRSKTKEWK